MTFEQIDTIARQVLRFANHDQYWRFNAIVGHLSPAETEAVRSRARTILKGNIWMLTDEKKGALHQELGHLDEDEFMEVLRDAFAYRAYIAQQIDFLYMQHEARRGLGESGEECPK